jgi:hypothetical protein
MATARRLLLLLLLLGPLLFLLQARLGWGLAREREGGGLVQEDGGQVMDEDEDEEEEESEEVVVPLWATFDPNEVRHDNAVFFIEASGTANLTARQACAVEAAALHLKHRTVFVLLTGGNGSIPEPVLASEHTRTLLFLPNVRLRQLPITETFRYTQLWTWYLESGWQAAPQLEARLWLALGLLLLHRHGGLLLAWDALLLTGLPSGPLLGQCGADSLATHLLQLPSHHPLAADLLEAARSSLLPEAVSLAALDAALRRLCGVEHLVQLRYQACLDLPPLLPSAALCPVERTKHWVLFDPRRAAIAR